MHSADSGLLQRLYDAAKWAVLKEYRIRNAQITDAVQEIIDAVVSELWLLVHSLESLPNDVDLFRIARTAVYKVYRGDAVFGNGQISLAVVADDLASAYSVLTEYGVYGSTSKPPENWRELPGEEICHLAERFTSGTYSFPDDLDHACAVMASREEWAFSPIGVGTPGYAVRFRSSEYGVSRSTIHSVHSAERQYFEEFSRTAIQDSLWRASRRFTPKRDVAEGQYNAWKALRKACKASRVTLVYVLNGAYRPEKIRRKNTVNGRTGEVLSFRKINVQALANFAGLETAKETENLRRALAEFGKVWQREFMRIHYGRLARMSRNSRWSNVAMQTNCHEPVLPMVYRYRPSNSGNSR